MSNSNTLEKLMIAGALMVAPFFTSAQQRRIPENPDNPPYQFAVFDSSLFEKNKQEIEAKIILPALEKGDTIALFAPGYQVHGMEASADRWLNETRIGIERRGYHVYVPYQTQRHVDGSPYAGSDAEREQTLNKMIHDPSIKMIWCVQGGQGTSHIKMENLDLDFLKQHPKIMVGFSDFTALLLKLFEQGIPTVHGPVATYARLLENLKRTNMRFESVDQLFKLVSGEIGVGDPIMDPNLVRPLAVYDSKRKTKAEGILVGGNLSRFYAGKIDRWLPESSEDFILFIEDIDEEKRKYDEILNDLAERGVFGDNIKAIIIGYTTVRPGSSLGIVHPETPIEMILRYAPKDIPIRLMPVGHNDQNMSMPVGARVVIDGGDPRRFYLKEPTIKPKSTLFTSLELH